MTRVRWERLDRPGIEDFELTKVAGGWLLRGEVQVDDSAIQYSISVNADWETRDVNVKTATQRIHVSVDEAPGWRAADGSEIAHLQGCVDVDLAFTPSTNTLPIRRLLLEPGDSAKVRAAWLRYPELRWDVLEQEYARISDDIYSYRSPNFSTRLVVDSEGIVREYPGLWKAVR